MKLLNGLFSIVFIFSAQQSAEASQCRPLKQAAVASPNSSLEARLIAQGLRPDVARFVSQYPQLAQSMIQKLQTHNSQIAKIVKSNSTSPGANTRAMTTVVRGMKFENLTDFDPNGQLYLGDDGTEGGIDVALLTAADVSHFATPREDLPYGMIITLAVPTSILQPSRSDDWKIYSYHLVQHGIYNLAPHIIKIELFGM